jgi:pimeloyl-ACP methyl ester carboxylesterase
VSRTAPIRILRWIEKALLWLVVLLLVLALLGAIYQAIATQRDERTHPPPGEMVDVGGHELHINCVGQGSPTVILDGSLGNMSAHWFWVQQAVAKTTRICAYDRAGMGWSESGPEPRDAEQFSGELYALLEGADIGEGPYVLVGHSYGGLYARMYAARYPDEVAGVVLVDSSHPEQYARLPQGRENYERSKQLFAGAPLLARLGVIRLFDLNPAPPSLPQHQRAQVNAFNSSTRQVSATTEEFRSTPETTAQVGRTGSVRDRPLAVVSAGKHLGGWLKLQREFAAFSSDSSHRVVEAATHTSLVDDRSDAQATSTAIVEVVQAVRNDRPLAR